MPSSSPLTSEGYQSYQPYRQAHGYDVAPIPGAMHTSSWAQTRGTFGVDPLSAPSGLVSNGSAMHASLRRARDPDDRYTEGLREEGPPRKRVNRGPPQDAFDLMGSPQSPEVQHPGQRRRIATSADIHSSSSDDSLPDVSNIIAGPAKSRIVRGRPPASPDPPPHTDPSADPKFIRFRVTMPMESTTRVQAAWVQAGGDVKRATELLSDAHWSPPTLSQAQADAMGRVREIEEATRAQRAAAREKGKKSMIYANRTVLEPKPLRITSPPRSKSVIDLPSVSSPTSPVIAAPRRKRIKKMVVDSDSEPEYVDSDEDDDKPTKQSRQDTSNDVRALNYFNTTGSEALQELTGLYTSLA